MNRHHDTCQSCAHLMVSDTSETQFRCGLVAQPATPIQRQATKSAPHRVVQPTDHCAHWQKHSTRVLSEKFI